MRPFRLLVPLALLASLAAAQGCAPTIYYESPRSQGFQVQASSYDPEVTSDEAERGQGAAIQPWVLAYCLAHPSTNLPYYYERVGSWKGHPPLHFVVQTAPLVAEYEDRRDSVVAIARGGGGFNALFSDVEKKDQATFYARCCAASVGYDTWPACTLALRDRGFAAYAWGNKPEVEGEKVTNAVFSFRVTADPRLQRVIVITTRRAIGAGGVLERKTCVFDVSRVRWPLGGRDGAPTIGAFDLVDHEGRSVVNDATYAMLEEWPRGSARDRMLGFLHDVEVIPPEVVARSIRYLGSEASRED